MEIDLYTIAANIYIHRDAHIVEGLILYGPSLTPVGAKPSSTPVREPSLACTRGERVTHITSSRNARAGIYERNVGAEDGLRDKEAYQDQSITKSRVTDVTQPRGESFVVVPSLPGPAPSLLHDSIPRSQTVERRKP